MKIPAYLVILVFWIMPVVAVPCDNRILGTNIEMDITGLYTRYEVLNSYRALGATMEVRYVRSDLNACIAKYKPRIFNERLDVLDKEWYEGENKYLMLFHIKGFEGQKACVLFIGDQNETAIFESWINTGGIPALYEKTIDAYLACKKTSVAFDFTEALFYKIRLPDSLVLHYSEGSFFEVRRRGNQGSGETLIQFHATIYGRGIQIQPERYLSGFVHENEIIVESSDYKAPPGTIEAWRMLTQETGGNNYRYQYLMLLKDRRMLYINAVISKQEPKETLDEISGIVDSIRFD